MASLKKNFIYQTGYQILATMLPLVTSPYLSRTLGAESLGIYSFATTTVNYFVLFQKMGLDEYGSKSIAGTENKKEKSKTFFEIYLMQILLSVIAIFAYLIYLLVARPDNLDIFVVEALLLINGALDINWYFFGTEQFKVTITKNIFIKLGTLILIFLFVKSPSDLLKYSLIMASGTVLSEAVLFVNLRGQLEKVRIDFRKILVHLKQSLILFIPLAAMSVYHQMDKTMLGVMSTYTELGYYYNADKVINILIGVVTGFGTVVLPRVTQLLKSGKLEAYEILLDHSFELIMFLCSAITFGIFAIANEFTVWFFGPDFTACIPLISVLPFVIYFKSWSTIARNQYLIPLNRNSVYIFSVFIGAVVNFVVNFLLIRTYGAMGAVCGTMIAEALVSVLQFIYMNREVKVFSMIAKNWIYVVAGLIMYVPVRFAANYLEVFGALIQIAGEIVVGMITYLIVCFIWWMTYKKGLFYESIKAILKK